MTRATHLLFTALICAAACDSEPLAPVPEDSVDTRTILIPPPGYPVLDQAFVTQVGSGTSTITRSSERATAAVLLESQTPGHVLVLATIIFNFPEHCVEGEDRLPEPGPCRGNGPTDPRDGAIPAVRISADAWQSVVVGADGRASFEVDLVGDTPVGPVNDGPGLLNPEGAVIFTYVMDKGPLVDEGPLRGAQLNSLYGGCQGPPAMGTLSCAGAAIAQHLPK